MSRLQPTEGAAGMPSRLCSQIHASDEGAVLARPRSTGLRPQIDAVGAGTTTRHRRRRGTSPGPPASLPDVDDMLREILLRLSAQPSSLPRASAVCKRWRRLVADPKFLLGFDAHHRNRKPPLLCFFQLLNYEIVFTPTLDPPDRISPERFDFGRYSNTSLGKVLSCRHGRLLIMDPYRRQIAVCIPMTGEQHRLSAPAKFVAWFSVEGAVLCAARDQGHVHGCCHSSPFKVVLVSIETSRLYAHVYSSETSIWSNLISPAPSPYMVFNVGTDPGSSTLVGNSLYWWLSHGRGRILEFDLDGQSLVHITGPHIANELLNCSFQIIQEDGVVGLAMLSYPTFQIWHRKVDSHGVTTWLLRKPVEMNTILGLPPQIEGPWGKYSSILGSDEDTDAIFLCVGENVYSVQLKSMQSKRLGSGQSMRHGTHKCHPFMSFYTPRVTVCLMCLCVETVEQVKRRTAAVVSSVYMLSERTYRSLV